MTQGTQVPERDRLTQPPLPGDPGGQTLQGQGCAGGTGGSDQPLPGASFCPVGQRAGVHCPGSSGLV